MKYIVQWRKTGEPAARGNGAECAQQLGIKLSSFYTLASWGGNGKYVVERAKKTGRKGPSLVVCEVCGAAVARTSSAQKLCPACRAALEGRAVARRSGPGEGKPDIHALLRMAARVQRATGKSYGTLAREAQARGMALEEYLREVLEDGN